MDLKSITTKEWIFGTIGVISVGVGAYFLWNKVQQRLPPKTIKLNTGAEMPTLGFGTYSQVTAEAHKAGPAVKIALRNGYRHIDCAHIYSNEVEVGAAMKEVFAEGKIKRQDVFVTSKLWNNDWDNVEQACRTTLKNLGLDYLDLYLIHWPFRMKKPGEVDVKTGYDPAAYLATYKQMENLVKLGLVKAIGVSNMTVSKLEQLLPHCTIKPAVNQFEGHPYLQQTELTEFCKKHGIVVESYSPLGAPGANRTADDPSLIQDPVVKKIAEKHNKTPAQVLINWAVQRGCVALPKSFTEQRIVENASALDFILSEADLTELNALGPKNFRYIKGAFLLEKEKGETDWRTKWL